MPKHWEVTGTEGQEVRREEWRRKGFHGKQYRSLIGPGRGLGVNPAGNQYFVPETRYFVPLFVRFVKPLGFLGVLAKLPSGSFNGAQYLFPFRKMLTQCLVFVKLVFIKALV